MNKDLFEKIFRRYGMKEEFDQQEAVLLWQEAVGQLAQFAQASHVKDGVLHVVACNPTVAQELTLLSTQILSKLNLLLTRKPLRQLRIKSGDVSPSLRRKETVEIDIPAEELDVLFSGLDDPDLAFAFREVYRKQRNREAALRAAGGRVCPQCGITYQGRSDVCPGCRYDVIEESSLPN